MRLCHVCKVVCRFVLTLLSSDAMNNVNQQHTVTTIVVSISWWFSSLLFIFLSCFWALKYAKWFLSTWKRYVGKRPIRNIKLYLLLNFDVGRLSINLCLATNFAEWTSTKNKNKTCRIDDATLRKITNKYARCRHNNKALAWQGRL